jgi:2-methylcitrate dehydratase PrpD
MNQPVVQRLADFAAAPLPAAMAAEITADVARRVRDLFGVALAAGATEPAGVVAGVVQRWGGRDDFWLSWLSCR